MKHDIKELLKVTQGVDWLHGGGGRMVLGFKNPLGGTAQGKANSRALEVGLSSP